MAVFFDFFYTKKGKTKLWPFIRPEQMLSRALSFKIEGVTQKFCFKRSFERKKPIQMIE